MTEINWCLKQSRGISLIEQNINLSNSYIKEADLDLENCLSSKSKWKLISGYYACYNALYSLLMKSGIKSEIHDCTIELMSFFEFSNDEIKFLKDLKHDKIQNQYYLQKIELKDDDKVKDFIKITKIKLQSLTQDKIQKIRAKIMELENK